MKAAIFTISTSLYNAGGESETGAELRKMLEQVGFEVRAVKALPAERQLIGTVLKSLSDSGAVNLIITTGANGYTQNDCAPEAVTDVVDRLLPGIPEAIRSYSIRYSKKTILDRSVAGICGKTLIINLPEKTKAATENLDYILPELIRVVETTDL